MCVVFFTDNFSLPENTRSCWPVRPIPRRSYLPDAVTGEVTHSTSNVPAPTSTNTTIGVVIPTTPNSTIHQQQNQLNEQLVHHNQQLLSMRVPDGVPQQTRNTSATFSNDKSQNVEERLSQIQDYIRITTSLIDSINTEKVIDFFTTFLLMNSFNRKHTCDSLVITQMTTHPFLKMNFIFRYEFYFPFVCNCDAVCTVWRVLML